MRERSTEESRRGCVTKALKQEIRYTEQKRIPHLVFYGDNRQIAYDNLLRLDTYWSICEDCDHASYEVHQFYLRGNMRSCVKINCRKGLIPQVSQDKFGEQVVSCQGFVELNSLEAYTGE
ncbi:MAG: hypothetical protein NZM26_04245 [Patescibacteria group bacterium]|nr:hypothetical protein [Patescibacteria group bacterium]